MMPSRTRASKIPRTKWPNSGGTDTWLGDSVAQELDIGALRSSVRPRNPSLQLRPRSTSRAKSSRRLAFYPLHPSGVMRGIPWAGFLARSKPDCNNWGDDSVKIGCRASGLRKAERGGRCGRCGGRN